MNEIYDLIIIGGGPAGLSSGIYAAREKLNTLIIEKKKIGGLITITHDIDNYPGAIKNETGISLMNRMREQCLNTGVEIIQDTIVGLNIKNKIKIVKSEKKSINVNH